MEKEPPLKKQGAVCFFYLKKGEAKRSKQKRSKNKNSHDERSGESVRSDDRKRREARPTEREERNKANERRETDWWHKTPKADLTINGKYKTLFYLINDTYLQGWSEAEAEARAKPERSSTSINIQLHDSLSLIFFKFTLKLISYYILFCIKNSNLAEHKFILLSFYFAFTSLLLCFYFAFTLLLLCFTYALLMPLLCYYLAYI